MEQLQIDFNQYLKLKRDQYLLNNRKEEKNKFLADKRSKLTGSSDLKPENQQNEPSQVQESLNRVVSDLLQALEAQDYTLAEDPAEMIRRLVSWDGRPPLEELLRTNITPTLINFIRPENYQFDKLISEFSWILANIASGDGFYVQYLVDLNVIQKAFDLLEHDDTAIKENAIYLLANIAGESLEYRDQLLQRGIVDLINSIYSKYLEEGSEASPSDFAWFLSLLIRGDPFPDYNQIGPLVPIIAYMLRRYESEEVVEHLARTLHHLSEGGLQHIQSILYWNCAKPILSFLESKVTKTIKSLALTTLGNLTTGVQSQIEALMDLKVLNYLEPLLSDNTKLTRKQAAWVLSNIIATGPEIIDSVFKYEGGQLLKRLFEMIKKDDVKVVDECFYCLRNICSEGNLKQIKELIDQNFIEILVDSLREKDNKAVCLEALDAVLEKYKAEDELGTEIILKQISSCGGYDVIEALQQHENENISLMACSLIGKYFNCVDG